MSMDHILINAAFPAHAGMNRATLPAGLPLFGVPRACGDEPTVS